MQRHLLSANWQLKQRDPSSSLQRNLSAPDGWLPATVPGTVHQDLLAAGGIPDPFVGLNERDVQWVGERDWLYRCTFDLPPDFLAAESIALCCDGLDTFATAWLNGQQILVNDNMFVPRRVQVQSLLHTGQNELNILFASALRRGKEREHTHGAARVWKGDASRVYVRKAQYHYGWDWGPCLLTAGPWRRIWLEAYEVRIADLHCPAEVSADLRRARLPVRVMLEGADPRDTLREDPSDLAMELHLALYGPAGDLVDQSTLPVTHSELGDAFEVDSPELWWPHGYGAQPLYRVEASLRRNGETLDRQALRLGLRRLRLLQQPLEGEPGTTFLFEVNNTPLFCGGANWIPADSFTPRVTPDRYRALLEMAAEANMVMLRVWGGGIYEHDAFYDLCDELGLLVWQDFMFACGLYPALDWFQASVRAEAEATVRRLRHHPCLALWCGNNEDYQLAHSLGAYDADFHGDFTATRFPARAIYERLLLEVCASLDPTRAYWPASPFGGPDANAPTTGDRHTWDVWHGQVADYRDYPKFAGRFVSEFGMQAFPDLRTIEAFAPPDERYPASRTLDHHNKATDGPRRIAVYLSDNVRAPADMEAYIYATQLVQAEALAAAYRGWRRRWGGPGRYAVAGALVWQLDDCWPVTSWAIVDYALRPKPAYYVVRRELAPLVVGLARTAAGAEVWAVSGAPEGLEVELDLRAWTLAGEPVAAARRPASLPPNQATELGAFAFDASRPVVVGARLFREGAALARAASWPEPFKYFRLPDPGIELTKLGEDRLRLHSARPAKGVLLSAEAPVHWSDNMLDLMPDDEQFIQARGLGETAVGVRWLT